MQHRFSFVFYPSGNKSGFILRPDSVASGVTVSMGSPVSTGVGVVSGVSASVGKGVTGAVGKGNQGGSHQGESIIFREAF